MCNFASAMSKYSPFTTVIIAILSLSLLLGSTACGGSRDEAYNIAAPLDSLLEPIFPEHSPGAVAMVAIGDSVIYCRSFGMARLDTDEKMTPQTMLNVASTTKTFVAVSMLKLAEEGVLSLDDTITRYFPELPAEVFGAVTIRHILAHTSGIPDNRPDSPEQWEQYVEATPSMFGNEEDYVTYGKEKEFTRYLTSVDSLKFEPGTGYDPKDPPYMLLADIIGKVTGMSFESYLRQYIFAPAGITSGFGFPPSSDIGPGVAHGYRRARPDTPSSVYRSPDGRWEEYDYGEAPFFLTQADRGLFISPEAFAKWYGALAEGSIIDPSIRSWMRVPVVSTGKVGEGYSLGIRVSDDVDGRIRLYHRTERGGFVAVEAIYPDTNTIYLIFSNRNDWPYNEVADALEEILETHGVVD